MKKILLLATGGTIASIKTKQGLTPNISSDELLDYVSETASNYTIDTKQIFNIDSTNIQPEYWVSIADTIKENYDNYDGFVITHGTDTMAYTAAALSYMIQNSDKPIVITGAQKPINDEITDARKNLRDSIRFVADEQSHGVYVIFDGKAIIGTRARKTRTKSYSAFDSINYPDAAYIDDKRITHYISQNCENDELKFCNSISPSVFLLKLIPGMEPDVLDYIGEKYKCIVIESYGVGGLPFNDKRNFLEKLESLTKKGKIIVISTQVMLEGSDVGVYEVGVKALKNYKILQAYDMTVEAAVTKLMWIMSQTTDYEDVKKLFYKKISEDILF